MPTYEYHCDACEHNFDEFQAMSDKPLKKCPKCGRLKLRRVFGAGAAIIFKGSGFYQTDYRSESYKQAAKADQDSGAKSADNGKAGAGATATDGAGKTAAASSTDSTSGKTKTPAPAKTSKPSN